MSVSTLLVMADKKTKSSASRKRKTISLRMEADLLERLDAFCEAQDFPIDRTTFIEVAVRQLLDEKAVEVE